MADFKVTFSGIDNKFDMTSGFKDNLSEFEVELGKVQQVVDGAEPYDGEYTVTPKVKSQTLETKDKVLREDINILEIPIFSTVNPSGGETVYIAKEV